MRQMLIVGAIALIAVGVGAVFFLYGLSYGLEHPAVLPPAVVNTAPSVRFTELARGTQSMETRRVNYLITSAADLAKLWKLIDAGGQSPTVDFKTHSVIAVFAGTKPTTGYDISVTKVEDTTVRMVTILLTSPGGTCLPGQSLTSPYQILELSTTALPLEHTNVAATTSCLQ